MFTENRDFTSATLQQSASISTTTRAWLQKGLRNFGIFHIVLCLIISIHQYGMALNLEKKLQALAKENLELLHDEEDEWKETIGQQIDHF